MKPVISVKNLTKTYQLGKNQGVLEALKNVSFSVEQDEIFGILGPNGAGKTTTLEIIEGLKKQDSGEALVLGFDNLTQTNEIKKRIGIQLQSSDYLPHLSLKELLYLFASLYNQKADAGKLLTMVGLEEKGDERVKNLSGGQKQGFTLATSLVNNPEILFLDEPTTGLDPGARRRAWQLIKKLNSQGLTIIITSHYMEEAEYLCHRVAIMDAGLILKIAEPKKLIDDLSHTTQISFLVEERLDAKIFKDLTEIVKIYNDFPKIILEVSSLDNVSKIVGILKQSVVIFQAIMLTLIGIFLFNVNFAWNIFSSLVIVILGGGIFLLIGLLISNFADSYETAAPLTAAVGLTFAFFGNIFYPTESLPGALKTIAQFLPITYLSKALRQSYLYAFDFSKISGDLIALAIWFIVLLLVTIKIFKLNE
ncbi:MAG: ABC transporter ATP-binding protein/permease [Candidatus Doudnabacteria bacterium]|nr:ABC transporter ATP-binding protein/permease [Candidatus Doudnabacteria bacterium]